MLSKIESKLLLFLLYIINLLFITEQTCKGKEL